MDAFKRAEIATLTTPRNLPLRPACQGLRCPCEYDHKSLARVIRARAAQTTALSDILGAFSYALDLTEGQPEGHSLRCTWIAMRLADVLGIAGPARRDLYYAVMLKDLGCSSNAARIAELYLADDREFKQALQADRHGSGPGPRLRLQEDRRGPQFRRARQGDRPHPQERRGASPARSSRPAACAAPTSPGKLRFSEDVAAAIYSLDEHWDGGGKPQALRARPSRSARASPCSPRSSTPSSWAAARRPHWLRSRAVRARWLDPALCRRSSQLAEDGSIWRELWSDTMSAMVSAIEPAGAAHAVVDEDYLDDIAAAFGEVIDAKSPYTAGHSERVGHYADLVAQAMGIGAPERRALRRAAILHDVGKLGVSSKILEKPGKLEADEWHVMQNHAVHTTAILRRVARPAGHGDDRRLAP